MFKKRLFASLEIHWHAQAQSPAPALSETYRIATHSKLLNKGPDVQLVRERRSMLGVKIPIGLSNLPRCQHLSEPRRVQSNSQHLG